MKRFIVLVAVVMLGGVMLGGCGARWVRSPVVKQRKLTVSLEHKIADNRVVSRQFAHPADIDKQKLRTLLTQLAYIAEPIIYGQPKQEPVFQKTEIERLVPALKTALAKATPDQRVRFVSRNKGGGLLFKKRRETGGVVFVGKNGGLNLAFAFVNHEILEDERERFSQKEKYLDPLRIKSSHTPLVAPDYAEHRRPETGKRYPLWIVADMEEIPASAGFAAEPPKEKPAPGTGQKTEAREIRKEQKPASPPPDPQAPPKASADQGKPAGREKIESAQPKAAPEPEKSLSDEKGPAAAPPPAESSGSWEERKKKCRKKLQYAKELYESDLISEKEYKAYKEKLLNQL